MLLMVEKGIKDRKCHATYQYATAKNKYMKDYNKDKDSPYLMYWDANNLHRWAMFQRLPATGFEWKKYFLNLMKVL